MKHVFFIPCLLIFIFDFCQAQNQEPISKTNNYINTYASDEVKFNASVKNVSFKEIQGSPYLIDSFVVGSIYTNRKEQFQNIPVRYNIFTDNVEYIMGASSVLDLKNPETVEKIEFENYKLIYLSLPHKNNVVKGFFIVLTEGYATLLSKPRITLQKPTQQGAYNDYQPPVFLRHTDIYYLKIGNNHANIVRTKRKLIKSFPDRRENLTNYIKANNIKISDQKGLIDLVQFYNSLQQN
jgi:hypothetical protein